MNNITQNTNVSQFALADKRHVSKYYYDVNNKQWFLILDWKLEGIISTWTLCPVAVYDGEQIGEMRTTQKDMEANKFADRPFYVTLNAVKTEFEWFVELVNNFNLSNSHQEDPNALYLAYIDRRRYCCSFDALVRIGLRQSTQFVNSLNKTTTPLLYAPTALDKLKAMFINN
jgi:hypothetical protein